MVPIAQEKDVEILQRYTLCLEAEVKRLTRELALLRNEKDQARQQFLSNEIQDQLTRLREKFFGFGRETVPKVEPRPVGHENQELLPHATRPVPEGKIEAPKLPECIYLHRCAEETLAEAARDMGVTPESHEVWEEMPGFTQDSTVITVTERVYTKARHRRVQYRLKDEYNKTGKEVIISAPGPVKVKPQSRYSVDFALSTVIDKYEFHLPLERQRRKMEAAGLDIEVKTLFSLCRDIAELCEKDVIAQIRQDILKDFCAAHLDESPWPLLGGSSGYMWALSNRSGSYFQFEPSRSGKIACEILKNHKGAILTDGYSGYKRTKEMQGVRVAHCWSHARREFFERFSDYPTESTEVLKLIDELFAIERKADGFESLRKLRREESRLVVKTIQKWLFETRSRFLPGDGIVKAIDYCLNQWAGLTLFLKDLSVPLSNNDAERALRHIVMGRKNFAGSKSIDGADVAAVLYTVIESAKRAGLQPRDYLNYVVTERWYKRVPLSPLRLARLQNNQHGNSDSPKKDDWRI
jgi:transposase